MFPKAQCQKCKRLFEFKGDLPVGKDFYCQSCGALNRIQGFTPTNTGIILVCELIEDDEYNL